MWDRYLQCKIFKALLNIFFRFSATFKKQTFVLLCKCHPFFSGYNPLFILPSFTQHNQIWVLSRHVSPYSCICGHTASRTKLTLSTLFPTRILMHSWLVEYRSTSFAHRFDKFVKVSRRVTSYTDIEIKWEISPIMIFINVQLKWSTNEQKQKLKYLPRLNTYL